MIFVLQLIFACHLAFQCCLLDPSASHLERLLFFIMVGTDLFYCRERDTDIAFAQDAIDDYKVAFSHCFIYDIVDA